MKTFFPSFFVNFLFVAIFPKQLTREKVLEQFTFTQKLSRGKFSIFTVTRESDFQFSKFYNINRALEPNIHGSDHATMI